MVQVLSGAPVGPPLRAGPHAFPVARAGRGTSVPGDQPSGRLTHRPFPPRLRGMIRLLDDMPVGVLGLEAVHDVEKEDYETVLLPAVDAAIAEHGKVRLLCARSRVRRLRRRGRLEDLKLGVRHPASFERIAIVTDARWAGPAIRIFSVLWPGQAAVGPRVPTRVREALGGCGQRLTGRAGAEPGRGASCSTGRAVRVGSAPAGAAPAHEHPHQQVSRVRHTFFIGGGPQEREALMRHPTIATGTARASETTPARRARPRSRAAVVARQVDEAVHPNQDGPGGGGEEEPAGQATAISRRCSR